MSEVAIDTNLMLLLIVGRTRRDFVSKHKRLQGYSEDDFDSLAKSLRDVETIITTPNVMTEVSNLLVQGVLEPLRSQLRMTFSEFAGFMKELYHPVASCVAGESFVPLGLTDATWLCVLQRSSIFLTDDRDLANYAYAAGVTVLSLDELRTA